MRQLFSWSQSLPIPRGILIVSAHWEAAPLSLSATAASTPLVYDFSGFAPVYSTMSYPTPDAGDLGELAKEPWTGLFEDNGDGSESDDPADQPDTSQAPADSQDQGSQRLPIPTQEAQDQAKAAVRRIFHDDITAARTPAPSLPAGRPVKTPSPDGSSPPSSGNSPRS